MNELTTTTKLLAILAVTFVTAALVTLPYQNQVANAAPMKKYQIYVTLIGVPANAEDLVVNATIFGPNYFAGYQETTVSSPSEGDTVKFVFKVPAGGNENSFYICGRQAPSTTSSCELHSLPSTGGGPIRVDYTYPQGP
jgi:hypothetical protein